MIPAEGAEDRSPTGGSILDLTQVEKVFRPVPQPYVKAAGQSLPADERRSGRTLRDARFALLAKFHGEFTPARRPTLQQDAALIVVSPSFRVG